MARRPPARRKPTRTRATAAAAPAFLTPARKRELGGAGLLALGVITLVSFISQGGKLTQWWVDRLLDGFGRGAYGLPILMAGLGAWFIVDSMDDRADLRWSRPAGALGLYLSLLGLLHLVMAATRGVLSARLLVETRVAGGWMGYILGESLRPILGTVPAIAALAVLALLSVSYLAGKSLNQSGELLYRSLRAGSARLWERRDLPGGWMADARAWLIELRRGRSARRSLQQPAEMAMPSPAVLDDRGLPLGAPAGSAEAAGAQAVGASMDDAALAGGALAGAALRPAMPDPQAEWQLPDHATLLEPVIEVQRSADESEAMAATIVRTLADFGIPVEVVQINPGPTITQFGLKPGFIERSGKRSRVSVRRIVALQNDLALSLAASPVRILAPVPGRPYLGVEVPNKSKAVVSLRGVLESEAFQRELARGGLPIAMGRDTSGHDVAVDLTRMPHLLVAGATGSGKSVCINTLISSLLLTQTPERLKLILVDPKRVEMTQYRGLPHLATPVVVEAERVVGVLQWAVREMDRRYQRFAEAGARHLAAYNLKMEATGQPRLPFLVIIIDELADLMMMAPDETERLITRLAQLARATGIHLVLATQRPSVDVVTGLIKANFPSRIAFAVSSSTDSRVILDSVGADKLLGQGDMLYMASDDSKLRRLQGCYVSDEEIVGIVRYWKHSARVDAGAEAARRAPQPLGIPEPLIQPELWDRMVDPEKGAMAPERDALWDEAVALIREHKAASTSFLQRKLRIGYSRAARLIDELEVAGMIGPAQGNNAREILDDSPAAETAAENFRTRLDKAFESRVPEAEALEIADLDPPPAARPPGGWDYEREDAGGPVPLYDAVEPEALDDSDAEDPDPDAAFGEPSEEPDDEPDDSMIRPWMEERRR